MQPLSLIFRVKFANFSVIVKNCNDGGKASYYKPCVRVTKLLTYLYQTFSGVRMHLLRVMISIQDWCCGLVKFMTKRTVSM